MEKRSCHARIRSMIARRDVLGCVCPRVRVLAGFANAVILLFVAFNIVLEAAVHVMGGGHDVTTHRLLAGAPGPPPPPFPSRHATAAALAASSSLKRGKWRGC